MKKLMIFCVFATLAAPLVAGPGTGTKNTGNVASYTTFKLAPGVTAADIQPGKLIIRLNPSLRMAASQNSIAQPSLESALQAIGCTSLTKKFPQKSEPASAYNRYGQRMVDLSLIYEVSYSSNAPVEKVINCLLRTGMLLYAEPKYLPHLHYTPNDPNLGLQYFLGKIQAYSAWDISTGDTSVVIGITDTGSDLNHPDLVANIKHNYADPINGTDDDGDGYIDNFTGWDLGENDNDPSVGASTHGSHVSGCAAAVTDNNTGVASPGYNTKFMPVKIADASGALTVAYEGIVYAADHGCSIINCSWGGSGGGSFGQDVVEYATINMDALVVASAGNDGAESDLYPAAYDYVLAVASTGTNDAKSNFSNYGPFIDVCAPGSNIYSTIYNNTYTFQSGTSMAAPIASGAAAIVKAMHPTFNAQQVGEQLRITCDNIYGVPSNNIYIDKLGKGRINMFRSITETSPSVRLKNIVITDNNDNAFVIGDTLDISGDFINYLDPTVNLDITVTTSSPWVTMIDNNTFVGALGTMATVNNTNDPFLFKINPGTPQNTKIRFKINYADAPYADFQLLDVTVNVDYINVAINEIATTITSKGRLCYNNETQQEGLGFQYNGENLVYEAGLMVGTGITTVSDNVRGAAATDNDFQSQLVVQKVLPSVVSEFDLYGQFNDSPASPSIPVTITHKAYAWSTPGNTKFVIVEYAIKNSGSSTLSNLYAGIFADWDIMDYSLNKADETPALKMGHVHSTQTAGLWAGIKVLTSGPFVHYGIDNIAGMGGVNMTDGYDTGEKYTTLSTSRPQAGTTGNGNDVIDVVSTGPYSIAAGDSVVVAFALIAGDDLNDLNTSAANAQIKYDNILLSLQPEGTEMPSALPYPNPVNNTLNIISTSSGLQNISVYDLSGREVIHSASRLTSGTPLTLDVSVLSPGIYTIMILSETGNTVLKFTKN